MSIRGATVETTESWVGLDTFSDPESLTLNQFSDSLNVVIQSNGNVMALRSPANWNAVVSTTGLVLSAEYYDRVAGGVVVFDVLNAGAVITYYTTGSTNTLLRSGQANARWMSVNVGNSLLRTNGTEYVMYGTALTSATSIGISAPAVAPTLSIVAGGTLVLAVGVTGSYAYRNSTTGHIGEASAVTGSSGATGVNKTLRTAVVASTQTGVDGIVLFLSADGGAVRYLVINAAGDPIVYANSTANIDISAAYNLNLLVQETQFNAPPVAGADFFFRWKDRLVACGYTSTTLRAVATYSGRDQIAYGDPYQSWPPLNLIPVPGKSERLRGGIETVIGALLLSERDGYLIRGALTDKVDSGENTIQFSEQVQQLKWNVGTRSPLTIQGTPFGTIWLDQDKHLRFWPTNGGEAAEIALGLRAELATIQDTDAARAMAEARWFQTGDQAGFYVLTGSTTGTTNNRMWIVTVIEKDGQLFVAVGASDIAAQCLAISRISGTIRCLIGVTDRLRQILDFTLAGAGWGSQQIYFEMVAGNKTGGIFHTFATVSYAATRGILAQVRDFDSSNIETLDPDLLDSQSLARVNRDGVRHRLRFIFPTTDDVSYQVKNVMAVHGKKSRVV